MKNNLPHCPCGRPAIRMRDDVPCCQRCNEWEDRFIGKHLHGERRTAFDRVFEKYKKLFHFHTPENWHTDSDKSPILSSFNH